MIFFDQKVKRAHNKKQDKTCIQYHRYRIYHCPMKIEHVFHFILLIHTVPFGQSNTNCSHNFCKGPWSGALHGANQSLRSSLLCNNGPNWIFKRGRLHQDIKLRLQVQMRSQLWLLWLRLLRSMQCVLRLMQLIFLIFQREADATCCGSLRSVMRLRCDSFR